MFCCGDAQGGIQRRALNLLLWEEPQLLAAWGGTPHPGVPLGGMRKGISSRVRCLTSPSAMRRSGAGREYAVQIPCKCGERRSKRKTECSHLNYVEPTFTPLALADERLGFAKLVRQICLRESALLPGCPERLKEAAVVLRRDALIHGPTSTSR